MKSIMEMISAQWTDDQSDETIVVMFSVDAAQTSIGRITELAHEHLKDEGADLLLSEVEWEYL